MNTRKNAFTLLETIVVIVVILLLVAILLPSLAGGPRPSIRAHCAANLHATGLALASFATQNAGQFPQFPSGGSWMNDGPPDLARKMTAAFGTGGKSDFLFCPSNTAAQDPTLAAYAASASPPFGVMGYFLMTRRIKPDTTDNTTDHGGAFPPTTQVT